MESQKTNDSPWKFLVNESKYLLCPTDCGLWEYRKFSTFFQPPWRNTTFYHLKTSTYHRKSIVQYLILHLYGYLNSITNIKRHIICISIRLIRKYKSWWFPNFLCVRKYIFMYFIFIVLCTYCKLRPSYTRTF